MDIEHTECYFIPRKDYTSATICANCGKEKFLHTIGEGVKVTQTIIISKTIKQNENIQVR